ncbi:MAG: YggS family pyridoxal phosphate-dependent enzyme [Bacteroidales bacterium]|nr:YggS family pyridoxal phosphate-dependent enzyme [Bacteroidales bacterium]HHY15603.1 YggS family pyridoxal phosphate-dependent enzyme [Bacillota bacterium]
MSIKANLASVRARIGQAADRSGRDGSTVKILGVTKFAAPQEMQELVTAGLASFGENRIQQAVERIELFPDVEWHFIGNLQTNKVRFCQQFYLIHSLDRLRLARALNRRAQDWGKLQKVLVQVNVSGEASKSGLQPERVRSFVQKILLECPHLEIRGLMTMAPLIEAEKTRPVFRQTKALYDQLQQELGLVWDTLSMGMTNDFEVAVEEGATLVRIGSALFAKEEDNE